MTNTARIKFTVLWFVSLALAFSLGAAMAMRIAYVQQQQHFAEDRMR